MHSPVSYILAAVMCVSAAWAQNAANDRAKNAPNSLDERPVKLNMSGPDAQNLMLGVWAIKVTYAPSAKLPDGGTGEGTETWRPGPGGLSVIEEYHEKNAKGDVEGFSIGWWDKNAGGQRFVWCANDVPQGCVVPESVAKWQGDRLIFREDTQEHGRKITHAEIFTDITPDSFTQLLQEGEPGEAPKTTVTILARRKQSSATQSGALPTEDGLRAAMAERRKAMLAGDEEIVERLTADDYVQTDISGYVQDKSAWLNEYFRPLAALMKAGKFRWDSYEEKDVQVRMFGDAAVVIGSMNLKGTGAKPSGHTWAEAPERRSPGRSGSQGSG